MMDGDHLKSLIAVAEHRGITPASRAIGLTQPALSRRLMQLEDELGATLLERSKRGVTLTEAGRLVCDEARDVLERFERLKARLKALASLEAGVVRLGGGATAVSYLIPPTLAAFAKLHPAVRFEVVEEGSKHVEEDVLRERIELGIVTLPTHSKDLEIRPLRSDRIVLVSGARHPLAQRKQIALRDLEGLGLVAFERESAIRRLIDAALRRAGVTMQVQMELRSIAATLEMVAHSDLVAFVSHLGVAHGHQGVHVLPVKRLKVLRKLAIIHKRGRPLSQAAKAFSSMLLAAGRQPL